MNFDTITTFAIISVLLVISPGPNGVLFLKTVPMYGKRSGMGNLVGIFSATYVHGALSFFGLSAIILSSATLFMMIKIIGALYLAFLGIKAILQAFKSNNTKIEAVQEVIKTPTSKKKRRSDLTSFTEGFLTQLLNPKVSMFYLAAFPQLIDFKNSVLTDIFLLVSIHSLSIFIWFTAFIFILGKSTRIMKSSLIQRVVQSFTGTIFLYFSYKILSVESKS